MQSEQEEFIITKFKRYGQQLNRKSLQKAIIWLRQNKFNTIDTLLKKLSQLSLQNSNNTEENIQHAIQILSYNNKNLNSYDDLLEQTRKSSIFYISPYQYDDETWFIPRPSKQLFQFVAQDKLKLAQKQFKRISQYNKDLQKQTFIGVIYQDFSKLQYNGRAKIKMQNQVNQIQINLTSNTKIDCLLLTGCTYIAKGKYQSKDLSFTVSHIMMPNQILEEKKSLIKLKFKRMCENISAAKQTTGYQANDFVKYDCVYSDSKQGKKPSLIFGNVTINKRNLQRIRRIVDAYPQTITSLFILLSGGEHQSTNLHVWFKCKVFIVPHITSDGPHLLPKLPLLKNKLQGCQVLTNPARISFEGKQLLIANYPLIKSIFSNVITPDTISNIEQTELASKVSDLIFSQGHISMAQSYYWKQAEYFNIHNETLVIINDGVATVNFCKSKGKTGGLIVSGNFDRDGDFLFMKSNEKNIIQFCEQPQSHVYN